MASWYGDKYRGRRTASGERFDPSAFTAAHPTLPFGTWVAVTDVESGRSVVVRITDRGPFDRPDGIDLSRAAARVIGLTAKGRAPVWLARVEGNQLAAFPPAPTGLAANWWEMDSMEGSIQPYGD